MFGLDFKIYGWSCPVFYFSPNDCYLFPNIKKKNHLLSKSRTKANYLLRK